MARGNQGQKIFADDLDRRRWLETLGEAVEKTGWQIHAYVLMGNHYHLLLETPEANLVVGTKESGRELWKARWGEAKFARRTVATR